jgi:putative ABC transport system permease protein
MLGVALGVAVVVAVDLANESAWRAFTLSNQAMVGASTHQIVGGPRGLDEDLYTRLRLVEGLRNSAPVVEGLGRVPKLSETSFQLLGIDPFAENRFRVYQPSSLKDNTIRELLTGPPGVLLLDDDARQLGLKVGDSLTLNIGSKEYRLHLVGMLHPQDALQRTGLRHMLIMDISVAQEILGMQGRLSRIDIILPDDDMAQERLSRLLPAGVQLLPASNRNQAMAQMTRAFRLNLTAFSLLALVVGMFLIFNTMTFSVVQRRGHIATMRILGVTRREVFTLLLIESLVIAVVGTTIGLLLGMVLAQGLVHLVSRTINDLYFLLAVRGIELLPWSLVKGLALGMGATLLAALPAAFEATAAQPRRIQIRSGMETHLRRQAPRAARWGVMLLFLAAILMLLPGRGLLLSYAGLFTIIISFTLLTPQAILSLTAVMQPLMGLLFGILGRMAVRNVSASISRTAPAIAALAVAVSVTIGVGMMIGSFRVSFIDWLDQYLRSDIYISQAGQGSGRNPIPLDAALPARLAAVPGITWVGTGRRAYIESPAGVTEIFALDAPRRSFDGFQFTQGKPDTAWPLFRDQDAVLLSEPYAYHHKLQVGDTLRLHTDYGEQDFPIVGIYYDYGSDSGVVSMSLATYRRHWDDLAISSIGLYVDPKVNPEALVNQLEVMLADQPQLRIRSNHALRQASIAVFDRTFAITDVLRLLAVVVAFIGVLSALLALQLERGRELAVLRANGLTPRQLWGLVTTETGLIGACAGLLAIPLGLVLSLVLIHVVNRRSFGWSMQLVVDPGILLQALLLAIVAAVLAGLYPAYRMAGTSPALALRNE